MPTINVTIPNKYFSKVKKQSEREGFKRPADWTLYLIEKNISYEDSPRLRPAEAVFEMRQTGLYNKKFLGELERSLEYADQPSQSAS